MLRRDGDPSPRQITPASPTACGSCGPGVSSASGNRILSPLPTNQKEKQGRVEMVGSVAACGQTND